MPLPAFKRWLIGLVSGAYGLLYLYMLGDIDIGTAGWGWHSLPWQWAHLLSQRSPWQFEALAMLEMGALVILLSPLNLLIAMTLSALLGRTCMALWLCVRAPTARPSPVRGYGPLCWLVVRAAPPACCCC